MNSFRTLDVYYQVQVCVITEYDISIRSRLRRINKKLDFTLKEGKGGFKQHKVSSETNYFSKAKILHL